jgi:hypothetical protein
MALLHGERDAGRRMQVQFWHKAHCAPQQINVSVTTFL